MPEHVFAALAQAEAWERCPAPFGYGEWLMATTPHESLAIVPPAVPASAEEQPADRQAWRVMTWQGPAGEMETNRAIPREIALADLVGHVPAAQHPWLIGVCERQFKQLDLWVRREVGPDHEARARAADQRRARLLADVERAFPARAWQAPPGVVPKIPATAAALLHEIDGPATSRADDLWSRLEKILRVCFYALVWVYRQAVLATRAVRRRAGGLRAPAGAARSHSTSSQLHGTEEHHVVGLH